MAASTNDMLPPREDVPPRSPAVLLLRDDPPCLRDPALLDLRDPPRALDLRPPRALVLRDVDLREPLLLFLAPPRPLLFRDPPLVLLRFVALAIRPPLRAAARSSAHWKQIRCPSFQCRVRACARRP